MIPSIGKTWKILDIQVFTFSDPGTNGMDVVYSTNEKGRHILLTDTDVVTGTNEVLIDLFPLQIYVFSCPQFTLPSFSCEQQIILVVCIQFENSFRLNKWLTMEKAGHEKHSVF